MIRFVVVSIAAAAALFVSCEGPELRDTRPVEPAERQKSAGPPAQAGCGDAWTFFTTRLWPEVLQPQCLACHLSPQTAGIDNSAGLRRPVFQLNADASTGWPTNARSIAENLYTVSLFLQAPERSDSESSGISLLEAKALGMHEHGGGQSLQEDSHGLETIRLFRVLLNGEPQRHCPSAQDETVKPETPDSSPKSACTGNAPCSTAAEAPDTAVDLQSCSVVAAPGANPSAATAPPALEQAHLFLNQKCAPCHATGQGQLKLDGSQQELGQLKRILAYRDARAAESAGSEKPLLKPLGELNHGGGAVADPENPGYKNYADVITSARLSCPLPPAAD